MNYFPSLRLINDRIRSRARSPGDPLTRMMKLRRISGGLTLPAAASSAVLAMLTAVGGLGRARAFQLASGAASTAASCRGSGTSWAYGRAGRIRERARLTLISTGAVRSASNVYGGGSRKRQGSVQMVEVRYEYRTPYLQHVSCRH